MKRTFALYDREARDFDHLHADVGTIIYPAHYEHVHTEESWYYIRTDPHRTNLSKEVKVEGWCGTTDNVSKMALGIWEILEIAQQDLKDGRYKVSVRAKKLRG